MAKINILQISDLHSSKANSVGNLALLDSIITDLQYIDEVEKIDIIVVCGDIVQGIHSDDIKQIDEIDAQYAEASGFLTMLCDKFVEGDRERVVIVPGNHDISWPHSKNSMRMKPIEVESDKRKLFTRTFIREMRTPGSKTRWSWDELCFMEINQQDRYTKRLEQFCRFFDSFYNNPRTYSATPGSQFSIYDYPELNITVLGLNSCDSLDHCNAIGRFNPDALAKSMTELKKPEYNQRVKIAVWHHGLYGSPYRSDYLDPLAMQNLIANLFSVGLHGHQHIPDFLFEFGRFGYETKMIVVGTGTLSGPPAILPPGQMRSYNIISIDVENEHITLYPREMAQSSFENPVWKKKYLQYTNVYPIVEKLYANKLPTGQSVLTVDTFKAIADAENFIGLGDYQKAIEILETLDPLDELARKLLVECYFELGKNDRIIEVLHNPSSVSEAIYVLGAADELNNIELIKELLRNPFVADSKDPALSELRKRLKRRIR
jgi:predicted phosphodiesterase